MYSSHWILLGTYEYFSKLYKYLVINVYHLPFTIYLLSFLACLDVTSLRSPHMVEICNVNLELVLQVDSVSISDCLANFSKASPFSLDFEIDCPKTQVPNFDFCPLISVVMIFYMDHKHSIGRQKSTQKHIFFPVTNMLSFSSKIFYKN